MTEFSLTLIKLADGTLIDPSTREPVHSALQAKKNSKLPDDGDGVGEGVEADEQEEDDVLAVVVPTARRSIMDLSLSKEQMAMINNVLVYTLWGLPDDEIAIQCNCSQHHLAIIRDLDDYKRMHNAMIDGLREGYTATVQGIMADAAPKAARGIVSNMKSKSADIKMAAMKDVLDRAGHRPADRVEHTHNIGNGSELVIRVIRQDDKTAFPTLDLSPNA